MALSWAFGIPQQQQESQGLNSLFGGGAVQSTARYDDPFVLGAALNPRQRQITAPAMTRTDPLLETLMRRGWEPQFSYTDPEGNPFTSAVAPTDFLSNVYNSPQTGYLDQLRRASGGQLAAVSNDKYWLTPNAGFSLSDLSNAPALDLQRAYAREFPEMAQDPNQPFRLAGTGVTPAVQPFTSTGGINPAGWELTLRDQRPWYSGLAPIAGIISPAFGGLAGLLGSGAGTFTGSNLLSTLGSGVSRVFGSGMGTGGTNPTLLDILMAMSSQRT